MQSSAAAGASTSKISSLFTKTGTPKRVFYIRDIKILKIDEQDPSVLHLGFAEGGHVSLQCSGTFLVRMHRGSAG